MTLNSETLRAYRTPALILAAVLAVVAWDRSKPPNIDPSASEGKAAGKQLGAYVRKGYALAFERQADLIAQGKTITEAQDAKEEPFHQYRHSVFDRIGSPLVSRIASDNTKLTDDQKAKLVKLLKEMAQGICPDSERASLPDPVPPGPSPKDPDDPAPEPSPPDGALTQPGPMGLVEDPGGKETILKTFKARTLKEACPALFRSDDGRGVYLYRAWKDVLGDYPKYPAQEIGDCTSFGSGHAIDLLQCIDIKVYSLEKDTYKETSTESIYGFGREVANMLGSWGDGCYGVAVAKGLTTHGCLPRSAVGAYSGKRAKAWGSGSGVPKDLREQARNHRLGDASLVTTLEEADAALNNGYPFILCSMQGFNMTRDKDGVCYARGTWPHCMFVAARRHLNSTKTQYLVCQSWGPNVPSGPLSDDQPDFSFWVDASTIAKMLKQEDSLAFCRFQGFAPRPLPSKWRSEGFGISTKEVSIRAYRHNDWPSGFVVREIPADLRKRPVITRPVVARR